MATVTQNAKEYILHMTEQELQRLGAFLQKNDVGLEDEELYKSVYSPLLYSMRTKYPMKKPWGIHALPLDD